MPSGRYAIGRKALDWVDRARQDASSPAAGRHRELMVYVWYPARASPPGRSAEYFPFAGEVDKDPVARRAAIDLFGARWPQIVAGSLRSHAIEDAPVASGPRFPVILFSPGFSSATFSYTAQIEYFVSHGYFVVAIEHTGAAGLVRFADGSIRLVQNPQPPSHSASGDPLQAMVASAEQGTQIGAEDLRFVLDMLGHRATPLAEHMDLSKVAAMGHSAGGTFSARACQIEERIRACVSEDGEVNPVGAFFDYSDHPSMRHPFLLLQLERELTDAELARMRESRAQWNHFVAHEHEQLAECAPGSYLVLLHRPGMNHASFSDGPILNAQDPEQAAVASENLLVTEELERAFLDKFLRGAAETLLDPSGGIPSGVQIEAVGHRPR